MISTVVHVANLYYFLTNINSLIPVSIMEPKNTKEKQEELLLAYIDIPYFRNNPAYIERWRAYYQKYKNPQILLLMYHKHISTFYHWIHIELAEHFLKKNQPQIAHFVLTEALKFNVYDSARIKKTLDKVPTFEKKYSKGDMLALLNTKNIEALGRIWNCYNESFFHLTTPPVSTDGSSVSCCSSYEIGKIVGYERKYVINENLQYSDTDGQFNHSKIDEKYPVGDADKENQQLHNSTCDDTIKLSKEIVDVKNVNEEISQEDAGVCTSESNSGDEVTISEKDEKKGEVLQQDPEDCIIYSSGSIFIEDKNGPIVQFEKRMKVVDITEEILVIPDNFESNVEIQIGQYIYLVRSVTDNGAEVLRIARDIDITQTMSSKVFFMRKCTDIACSVLSDAFGFLRCKNTSSYYIIQEYCRICDLKEIVGTISGHVRQFYLKCIIERILPLIERGYLLKDPLDFFVDQDFDLGLNTAEITQLDENTLSLTVGTLKENFLGPSDELALDLSMIAKLTKVLAGPASKKEIVKHKTEILQSL